MRLHAFGSLCDFLMTLFFVLLDNCLMRLAAFLPLRDFLREFELFVAYCVLIYVSPKSSPWNASKSLRFVEND